MDTPKQRRWEIEDDRAEYLANHARMTAMAATAAWAIPAFHDVVVKMSDATWKTVLDAYMEGYEAEYEAWVAGQAK